MRTPPLIVLAVLMWLAPLARAQTFAESLQPALSRESFKAIAAHLELDKDVHAAIGQLYEGYVSEHRRESEAYKAALEHAAQLTEPDQQEERRLEAAVARYAAWRPRAQATFLADLHGLVEGTPSAARWPWVERYVRRTLMRNLSWRGAVQWQAVDLVRGVGELHLEPDALAKVQPMLDEYELLIDKPLQRMEKVVAAGGLETGGAEALRVWEEGAAELRSANKRYLRMITQELTPDAAAKLHAWTKDQVYWEMRFWRSTLVRDGALQARKLKSFTAEQAKRADALIADMDRETADLRRQAEVDYDALDEKLLAMNDKDWKKAMERNDNLVADTSEKWRDKYNSLRDAWVVRLKDLLTQEQKIELWPPKGDPADAERSKQAGGS